MAGFLKEAWQKARQWASQPRVLWRHTSPSLSLTIEVQSWLPFLAFLATFAWYIASPSQVVTMALAVLGGILLAGFLWARAMAGEVRGKRRLRFAAMQVGDELEEEVSLWNGSWLPVLWAEFVDRSNIPGYTLSSVRAADPHSSTEWRVHTTCTRRGVYNLGPWELRLGEPLGIFRVRQVYLQRQEILVYPQLAVLPPRLLFHRGALGDSRPLNQPLPAETIASTSVRAYVPGDPLRHIHWRTSARRFEPFVKVFAPEAASSIWLAPDFDSANHSGEGPDSSEEMLVTVTASLAANLLLQHNLSVGMLANTEKEIVVLPRRSQAHLWPILQALAPLRIAAGHPLEETLARARSLISGNDLLIVITPSIQPGWIAPMRWFSRSQGGASRAEVILLAPDSSDKTGDAEKFISLLLEQGIPASLLHHEDLQLISGYYAKNPSRSGMDG
jgi:uncharacterized protein (DUF58 family)